MFGRGEGGVVDGSRRRESWKERRVGVRVRAREPGFQPVWDARMGVWRSSGMSIVRLQREPALKAFTRGPRGFFDGAGNPSRVDSATEAKL